MHTDFDKRMMSSKKQNNCLCGCCLIITLVIGFLSVVGTIAFGVVYYERSISGKFVVMRERVAELEMQLNQSQAAVSEFSAQVSNIPTVSASQTLFQIFQTQLNQTAASVAQSSMTQAQLINDEFIAIITEFQSVEEQATDLINATTIDSQKNFSDAATQIISDYIARVQSVVSQLSTESSRLLNTVNPLPTESSTQRTTYTRWGSSSCPNVTGTTLVYDGYTGGSPFTARGGGANILCLPKDPELNILPIEQGVHDVTRMYGSEYESAFLGSANENVPCAVCSVYSRPETIMIPAKVTCPATWTREYYGYLMAENDNNFRTSFVCVDEGMEFIPGQTGHQVGCDLWLVEPDCDSLPCPPYDQEKELACVVCSK